MGIERSTRDRWILGVCGGIGYAAGVSPNMVRLILVAIVVFTGVGIVPVGIAYALAGYFLPESRDF